MPWARHGPGHTYAFDHTVGWLAVQCSKTAVTELMRIAWRTVGSIITRVQADIDATADRLAGTTPHRHRRDLLQAGIQVLRVVVDHDSGHLVWAIPGRDDATLHRFFDALGEDRCA